MQRPDFLEISSGNEFNRWYWLKEEMIQICKGAGLPINGSKFDLRDRIMFALDNNGEVLQKPKSLRPTSNFDWANENLSLQTIITDNVSFGPNFREFMKSQIGKKFSCHSDFMDWVKENVGCTLEEAISAWHALEARKKDPNFKRDIADHNMLSQYVRDFLEDNQGKTTRDAIQYWNVKRRLPTESGFVKYRKSDLELLG